MGQFLIVVGLLVGIIGLYILSYYLNKNTAAPEGVDISDVGCHACATSKTCTLNSLEKEDCDRKEH